MFDGLTERLSGVFDRLSGRGVLSEKDVDEALREVRVALLEADVALPVVREFIARAKEGAALHTMLLLDLAILRLEAFLKWLDHCEEALTREGRR